MRQGNKKADALAKNKLIEFMELREQVNSATNVLPKILFIYNVVQEDELLNQVCEICYEREPQYEILLCDFCGKAFHFHCVGLGSIPLEKWLCLECSHEVQQ